MQEWNHIGRLDATTNQDISRVNLKVARMTRKDGSLMKSIALLTMIFLPATFVAVSLSTASSSLGSNERAAILIECRRHSSPWISLTGTVVVTVVRV